MSPAERLAIIIPAYQSQYLAQTLASFAAQKDQRFRLYIADDASPDNLAAIVAPFATQLDLVYHRFSENLGRTSLPRHWERAIALSDETWIWLFSDDDTAEPNCVAAFWTHRQANPDPLPLFRFPTRFIDETGRDLGTRGMAPYPPRQTCQEHLQATFAPDHAHVVVMQNVVFSREIYTREGGLVDYPFGFWSDFVTWTKFARHGDIITISDASIHYRIHGGSISGGMRAGAQRVSMIRAITPLLRELRAIAAEAPATFSAWRQLLWTGWQFRYLVTPLNRAERREVARVLATCWPTWPLLRELVFWWHAGRPYLRRHLPLGTLLARRRQ